VLRSSAPAVLIAALATSLCAPASAQDEEEVSDDELIRWAANEVRILEGRPPNAPAVPMPPASYLGVSGENGAVTFADRTPLRVLAEAGAGALGFGIGAGLGALIVWAAIEARANTQWMTVAVGTGAILGALGVTSGVVLAGDALDGRGNFGHAFIGTAIGSALAIPLVVLGVEHDALPLSFVAASILPLAGAMIAYEIGHGEAGLGPVPFVAPTGNGVVGGVVGPVP
jgi:hypothetical protein